MDTDDDRPTILVVVDGDTVVARWRIENPARPDLSVIDTIARVHLAARRLGLDVRLVHPPPQLGQLVNLVGLADLFLDAGRQPEGGEELGI